VTVARVKGGSHADELGIQEGWQLYAIMDDVIQEHEVADDVIRRLAAASAAVREQPTAAAREPRTPRTPRTPVRQEAVPRSASQRGSNTSSHDRYARQPSAPQVGSSKGRAAASGPRATAQTRTGLIITFRLPDNSERNVFFGSRQPPMGMDFSTTVPLTTMKIRQSSHAEALGVEVGWTVIKVNGQSALGNATHEEVITMMKRACLS